MTRRTGKGRQWQQAADKHEEAIMKLLDPMLEFRERARWQRVADDAQDTMDEIQGER